MQHRTITGRILYTSRKPGREGSVRGQEYFTITRHGDGARTFRAMCEIEEPDPKVLRDVVYTVDKNDRPLDCLIRLTVGDQFMGAGLFRMTPDAIECESYGPGIGRVSQKMPVTHHYDGFGSHPLIVDGYNTRCVPIASGQHRHPLRVFMTSTDHRGASPPLIASAHLTLAYVGEESVTVQAGRFDCRHFRFTDEDGGLVDSHGAHPAYDVWVTADDDTIFVRGGVEGYMMTHYELVELSR